MGFRVLALLGFFTIILTALGMLIGYILLGTEGAIFLGQLFLILSLILNVVARFSSSRLILRRYNARMSKNKELNDMVDRMAVNAKIPTPKVYILPIDIPNSFSTGRNAKGASLCVTEGLLNLNKGEIESVVAHEIWHIANKDIMIQSVTAVIANFMRYTVVLFPFAVFITRIAISRKREYKADYFGTLFAKKPKDMASALNKINDVVRNNPMKGSPAFECIWIVNPFKRARLSGMFSTHPPTARRAMRVEEMDHEGMPEHPEATEV